MVCAAVARIGSSKASGLGEDTSTVSLWPATGTLLSSVYIHRPLTIAACDVVGPNWWKPGLLGSQREVAVVAAAVAVTSTIGFGRGHVRGGRRAVVEHRDPFVPSRRRHVQRVGRSARTAELSRRVDQAVGADEVGRGPVDLDRARERALADVELAGVGERDAPGARGQGQHAARTANISNIDVAVVVDLVDREVAEHPRRVVAGEDAAVADQAAVVGQRVGLGAAQVAEGAAAVGVPLAAGADGQRRGRGVPDRAVALQAGEVHPTDEVAVGHDVDVAVRTLGLDRQTGRAADVVHDRRRRADRHRGGVVAGLVVGVDRRQGAVAGLQPRPVEVDGRVAEAFDLDADAAVGGDVARRGDTARSPSRRRRCRCRR